MSMAGYMMLFALPLHGQPKAATCDASLDLANMLHTAPKGRLQDKMAPQTSHLIGMGKQAIPALIACLTDETKTERPIEDYWPVTTVGDIAFFHLCDFITDSSGQRSTIGGLIDWRTVSAEYPNEPSWTAWYSFVKKHGRKYVQGSWSKRWKEIESTVYWDEKENCFKLGLDALKTKVRP